VWATPAMAWTKQPVAVKKPLLKQPTAKAAPKTEWKPKWQSKWQPKWQSKWQPKWQPKSQSKPGWQSKWQPSKWLPKWASQKRKSGWKKSPPTIPRDFEVDKEARFSGTVTHYFKWKGFGFIKLSDTGVVPNDELHVSWQNIKTDDRYPFLLKGMEVEFGVMKWRVGKGKTTLCAKSVTLVGGGTIAVQDEVDAKKEFVGGQHLRYTGKLKNYNPKKSAGWVVMDDGFELSEDVEKELKVEEHEVNCGGKKPMKWMEDLDVEFGIVKDRKGRHKVYNMTLPGGAPMTPENIDKRRELGSQTFKGKIHSWNAWKRWGFIEPETVSRLPRPVQEALNKAKSSKPSNADDKLLYFNKTDVAAGTWPKVGMAISFRAYVDEKGAGAHKVTEVEA